MFVTSYADMIRDARYCGDASGLETCTVELWEFLDNLNFFMTLYYVCSYEYLGYNYYHYHYCC